MLVEIDELDTMKLTEGYIVEAVLKAHKDAPAHIVEGLVGMVGEDYSVDFDENDKSVATIKMLQPTARLASLKASDSHVVVVDPIAESSPIARMQNNKYVRGTYDDPKLIVKSVWKQAYCPEYAYYSVMSDKATFKVEYIPYPELMGGSVQISSKLKYAVLTLLVAMVLDALSYPDKANIYKAKYQEYLQTYR